MRVSVRARIVTWWQRSKDPIMSTTESASTNLTPPTTSTTASVASPAPITFPIQGIHPPTHLDVKENIAENWKTFKQAWGNYAIIMNIHQQPETYQVALFLHCIGPEALKIFNGMPFDNPQEKEKLECIIKKFDEFTCSTVGINRQKKPSMHMWLCCVHFRRHVTSVNASENHSSVTGSCWESKTRKQEKDFYRSENSHLTNASTSAGALKQAHHK